ncbi:hypothetical protein NITMOv2_0767 [Nitrospira moscoviensis]|uniref:Uncharacterized protein n=1 Tax=Nitrospira moscoviensis TaxID=42253 RepID=A0A0K2G8B7_NITMO|nr:hypothetical protein NITMOv2_0767 [Nitrospira moscoviensis]
MPWLRGGLPAVDPTRVVGLADQLAGMVSLAVPAVRDPLSCARPVIERTPRPMKVAPGVAQKSNVRPGDVLGREAAGLPYTEWDYERRVQPPRVHRRRDPRCH